jgi:cell wall-associated NlpC family hydrolase
VQVRTATRAAGVVLALAALGASTAVGTTGGGKPTPPDARAARVLAAAKDQLGDKYVYGATGPARWDCSGLTSRLWRTVGGVKTMPRRSRDQQAWAWPIRAKDALPGDLVFFGNPVTHVGIYEGRGRIIDASSSRRAVVERAIWTDPTIRYGRVPRAGVPHPPAPRHDRAAKPHHRAPKAPKAAPRHGFRAIPHPGHRPRTATTKQMAAFVAALRTRSGARWQAGGTGPRYDAAGLVRWGWARAGYGTLPRTPAAIEHRARPVSLRNLAVGDLIFWGARAVHVAVYVGNGQMIDASRVLRVVSRRWVFASETVRFARLTPPHKVH